MTFQGEHNLIILPTYNEAQNLPRIIPAILEVLPKTHILVVDDQSPDGTGAIAEQMSSDPRIHVLQRKEKKGLGPAYLHGFSWALERDYQTIFEMDADFSHPPQFLPDFLNAIQDCGLVLGCRYMPGGAVEGWGWHRRLLSRGGNFYAKRLLNLQYRDLTGGFKCFRRSTLQALDFSKIISKGYNFQIELTWHVHQRGIKIKEIPIIFPDRQEGVSKMNWSIFHEAIFGVWQLRRQQR